MKNNKLMDNSIYLKNLGYFDATSKLTHAHKKLLKILSAYGEVRRIEIFSDKNSCFVEMSTPYEAENVRKYLDGTYFNSKN